MSGVLNWPEQQALHASNALVQIRIPSNNGSVLGVGRDWRNHAVRVAADYFTRAVRDLKLVRTDSVDCRRELAICPES